MARLVGYELGDRFARGGMAEVFLANPPPHLRAELGEHVAVKQLLPELEAKDEFLDMFLEEGKLALLLEHPNLVRPVGVGTIEARHAIVMEPCEAAISESCANPPKSTGSTSPSRSSCESPSTPAVGFTRRTRPAGGTASRSTWCTVTSRRRTSSSASTGS